MKIQGNVAETFLVAEPFEAAHLKSFELGELRRKVEGRCVSAQVPGLYRFDFQDAWYN